MARGEGDTDLKSNFVSRVVKLPMVHVVWDYASNTYTHIKESNKLVNFTLTNAEKTANFVAGQAKPVVLKFEKQIQAVDDLACKGLGTLEEKVPFITKPADEIIGETRKLYSDTVNSRFEGIVKYGNETVRTAADFGLRQATNVFGERLVQSALTTVDGFLVVTQNYLDHYMAPPEGDKVSNGPQREQKDEKPAPLTRIVQITNTIRRRTYRTLVIQFENLQERALDLLLTYPIQIIEISKTQLDAFYEYLNNFWLAVTQEESQDSAERSQTPVAVTVVRNGAMWVMGMMKLIPQLLPLYTYGFISWLETHGILKKKHEDVEEEKEEEEKKDEGVKENGSVPHHTNDHSHTNNVH